MPGTVRRSDLGAMVSARLGLRRAAADAALGAVLESIQEALVAGDRVVLTGFGAFEVRRAGERSVRPLGGRGGSITVPAHNRVGFVPGAGLKAAVAGKG